jgi:hypothetical protein
VCWLVEIKSWSNFAGGWGTGKEQRSSEVILEVLEIAIRIDRRAALTYHCLLSIQRFI